MNLSPIKKKLAKELVRQISLYSYLYKWLPRKGLLAVELRKFLELSPKRYRKLLVENTKVVETQMCAKDWENINFNAVPSLASARYKKAFNKHSQAYKDWCAKLATKDSTAKVNAGAVYPYDVLKGVTGAYSNNYSTEELAHIVAQWEALPNYVGDASILPLVDVSGSMTSPAGGWRSKSKTTCLDVAVSLGLYLSDKNVGKFNGTFLTFSKEPQLMNLTGNIVEKVFQMKTSKWGMNTNLHAVFERILSVAIDGNVPNEEMPKIVLILSDMQFDACIRYDDSAIEMIRRKYEQAGYTIPNVVFWNLNASYDNVPVKANDRGVALVSGFSPAIMKTILKADFMSPEKIVLDTISNSRYDY